MEKKTRKRGRPVKIKVCRGCGREFTKHRGAYCIECSMKRLIENVRQLHEKKGPWYEKWRQGMISYVYRLIQARHEGNLPKPLRKKSRRVGENDS